jgi:hypothetical protein
LIYLQQFKISLYSIQNYWSMIFGLQEKAMLEYMDLILLGKSINGTKKLILMLLKVQLNTILKDLLLEMVSLIGLTILIQQCSRHFMNSIWSHLHYGIQCKITTAFTIMVYLQISLKFVKMLQIMLPNLQLEPVLISMIFSDLITTLDWKRENLVKLWSMEKSEPTKKDLLLRNILHG